MKVSLLHDWLTGFRGGERVLEVFCETFPKASLHTLIYQKGSTSEVIENRKIETSFLNRLPDVERYYRKLLPLFPLAVESMKLDQDCELVLSSSHCAIKGVKKPSQARHFCYIHSPMRYIYDQYPQYFGRGQTLPMRLGGALFRHPLQAWDKMTNHNVDCFIANSEFVRYRIKTFYQRDSLVVHPFVDLDDFTQDLEVRKKDYFLMVTAFAPNKRVDLAIKAFNQLGYPLKIIGSGQEEKKLKGLAQDNIEFLGNCSREQVVTLMQEAQAFIFPGIEDFGITPLESLASGTPVIALRAGGVLETLNDNVAVFFDQSSPEALISAVSEFSSRSFLRNDLFHQAQKFSKEVFKSKIKEVLKII